MFFCAIGVAFMYILVGSFPEIYNDPICVRTNFFMEARLEEGRRKREFYKQVTKESQNKKTTGARPWEAQIEFRLCLMFNNARSFWFLGLTKESLTHGHNRERPLTGVCFIQNYVRFTGIF